MDRKTMIALAAVIALVITAPGMAVGSDWSRWRGPTATGVSSENDWNPKALESGESVLWRTNVGMGHSAVTVQGDRLFTMGYRESKAGGETHYAEVVFCLDAASGREIWHYAYETRQWDFPGPGSTPVVDHDLLFTMGRDGELYCFDAARGSVRWKRDLVSEQLTRVPQWGFCASPAVEGDLLILNAASAGIAVNKHTGKTVWASEPGLGWLPTPVLYSDGGRRLAAISSAGTLWGVDAATGEVQWQYPWQSDADPVVLGDKVYLTGGGRGNGNAMLEVKDGEATALWETGNMTGVFQTSVILDGHAYGFGRIRRDQPLACIELESGEVKWRENLGDWGGIIAADGKLIVIDGDGDLIIAEATPEEYRVLARTKVFPLRDWRSYPERAPHCVWTAPTLANGKLYARTTHGDLVCVDMTAQAG